MQDQPICEFLIEPDACNLINNKTNPEGQRTFANISGGLERIGFHHDEGTAYYARRHVKCNQIIAVSDYFLVEEE